MSFWLILFALLAMLGLAGLAFLTAGFHRFPVLQRLGERHPVLSWLAAMLPVGALLATALYNVFTMIVIVLHLTVIWLLCDLVLWVFGKYAKHTRYLAGAAALLLTFGVLCYGWVSAHRVVRTHYDLTTDKDIGGQLRIVLLADAHLGVTLSGDDFADLLDRIADEAPDLLVICGDLVDDDTDYADMATACAAFSKLDCEMLYVPGNHDAGYGDTRDFAMDDLTTRLSYNFVTVLEDQVAVYDDAGYSVIGRLDAYDESRAPVSQLMQYAEGYTIVLDHEPNDYDAEAAAGADLVLSGHTHGGHIFPAGYVGLLLGMNDGLYGRYDRGETAFIVTSGVSGWAIPFKTGAISEYCVIDIAQK